MKRFSGSMLLLPPLCPLSVVGGGGGGGYMGYSRKALEKGLHAELTIWWRIWSGLDGA